MEVLWNTTSIIKVQAVNDDQVAFTPSTASYVLYTPGGAVLQTSTAATISGSTMSLTIPSTSVFDENYRADVTFITGSSTFYNSVYFDTVKMLLRPTLLDDDLRDAYPTLSNKVWDGETDWRRQKQLAWDELFLTIKSRGFRPALTAPSSEDFRLVHLHLTLSFIFRGFFADNQDKWYELYTIHKERYSSALEQVFARLKYDAGETQTIVAEERNEVSRDLIR